MSWLNLNHLVINLPKDDSRRLNIIIYLEKLLSLISEYIGKMRLTPEEVNTIVELIKALLGLG